MAERIPKDLAKAFDQAVLAYEVWHPSHEGREILIAGRGYFPIDVVCDAVSKFTEDTLPEHVFEKLRSYMHDQPHGDLIAELRESPTYGVGGTCLRRMMERRRGR
jgi:hypothetical protein